MASDLYLYYIIAFSLQPLSYSAVCTYLLARAQAHANVVLQISTHMSMHEISGLLWEDIYHRVHGLGKEASSAYPCHTCLTHVCTHVYAHVYTHVYAHVHADCGGQVYGEIGDGDRNPP